MIAPNYPPEKQKSAMPKRPNVIWVLADQLRAQALSCNGETNICTPNIDQLAMRGVNFTAAVSGYPLCCPYRGSMLTGLYPNHCTPGHDKGLPPEQRLSPMCCMMPVTTPPILANGTWMPRARLRPSAPTVKYSTLSSRSTAEALTIGWGTRTITNPGTVTCMVPTATAPACPALKLTH